jgi:hypothetical protein
LEAAVTQNSIDLVTQAKKILVTSALAFKIDINKSALSREKLPEGFAICVR